MLVSNEPGGQNEWIATFKITDAGGFHNCRLPAVTCQSTGYASATLFSHVLIVETSKWRCPV